VEIIPHPDFQWIFSIELTLGLFLISLEEEDITTLFLKKFENKSDNEFKFISVN